MSKISTILGGAFLCIALTGCENFLKGDEIKDEVQREIDYANAPSYTIYVVADRDCGQIRKPITGELKKKVTDTFELKFEPANDYTFVRWEASCETLSEEENIKDYIIFEDQGNPETTATFIKALDSIIITAVCPHLPSANYTITGSNGKFSPSKGTYTCTQSYTYQLAFEPDTDYEFIKWEIYDSATGASIPNGLYLTIADPKNENTNIVLNKAPADPDIKLSVRPVVTERPQILSNSPLYNTQGVYKDSTIQLVFDCDIDESSIYYTDQEMQNMIADRTADEGLFYETAKNGESVYYGYKKDNKTYFKNISIKDNKKGTNYNDKFLHPVFNSAKILTVSADPNHPLPDYAEVLVTVEKNFSYTMDNKPVSLVGSKKWIYQTNRDIDSVAPTVVTTTAFMVGTSPSNLISTSTSASSSPWLLTTPVLSRTNNQLYLSLEVNDGGSGPADSFKLILNKVYDESYSASSGSEEITVGYTNPGTTNSTFAGYVDLSDLPSGVYGLRFEFSDKNGRTTSYPANTSQKYFFTKDTDGPVMNAPSIAEVDSKANKLKFTWTPSKDLETALIQYKPHTESTWTSAPVISNAYTTKTCTIDALVGGTTYDFKYTYTDYNGNTTEDIIQKTLRPMPVTNVRTTNYNYNSATISWDAPTGNYDGYVFSYDGFIWNSSTRKYDYRTINVDLDSTTNSYTISIPNRGTLLSRQPYQIENITIKTKHGNDTNEIPAMKTYTGLYPYCQPKQNDPNTKIILVLAPDNVDSCSYNFFISIRGSGFTQYSSNSGRYEITTTDNIRYYAVVSWEKDGVSYSRTSDIASYPQ